MSLLGTPYRWGGESTEGFDCSGLVGYVYRSVLGMELPRVSRQMATTGEAVERSALVPGDLVFFGKRGRVSHVGIYVGEGRFLHAPSRGKDVRVDSLRVGLLVRPLHAGPSRRDVINDCVAAFEGRREAAFCISGIGLRTTSCGARAAIAC